MMLEWVVKGGWVMVPLTLLSILSVAVVLERSIALLSSQVLARSILTALEEGRSLEEIRLLLAEDLTVLGKFLNRIDQKRDETKEVLNELAHSYFKAAGNELDKHLEVLNVVASTSPLLGLLGTVLGMVKIFQAVSQSGLANPMVLSAGISEALITTITGLVIAVPALIFYTYFSKKVERYLLRLEESGKLFIALLKQHRLAGEFYRPKQYVD
jgi:biopolymer transport protein ExbB